MKQNCGYTIVCTEVFFVITASVKAKYNDGGKYVSGKTTIMIK